MIEFYPEIKWTHIAAVLMSGTLFLVRGVAVQLGARWAMAAPLRYISYSIDTILLTAALMLFTLLPGAVFANGWLITKVVLLVVYVVLGSYALKRGRTRTVRAACFAAALLAYLYMIGVARAHHPLGPFFGLLT